MPRRVARRALLGGLTAACFAPSAVHAAEAAGEVETSRGDCYAEAAARRRALAPAAEVFIGDAVGTGAQSALGLRLGSVTRVKLGAETRLRIDRFLVDAGGVLVLDTRRHAVRPRRRALGRRGRRAHALRPCGGARHALLRRPQQWRVRRVRRARRGDRGRQVTPSVHGHRRYRAPTSRNRAASRRTPHPGAAARIAAAMASVN